jgi:hypothetical protein
MEHQFSKLYVLYTVRCAVRMTVQSQRLVDTATPRASFDVLWQVLNLQQLLMEAIQQQTPAGS